MEQFCLQAIIDGQSEPTSPVPPQGEESHNEHRHQRRHRGEPDG
jgi:hypothetical protein